MLIFTCCAWESNRFNVLFGHRTSHQIKKWYVYLDMYDKERKVFVLGGLIIIKQIKMIINLSSSLSQEGRVSRARGKKLHLAQWALGRHEGWLNMFMFTAWRPYMLQGRESHAGHLKEGLPMKGSVWWLVLATTTTLIRPTAKPACGDNVPLLESFVSINRSVILQ